jgi:hypothetical protein
MKITTTFYLYTECREYSSIARDDSLNNQNECEHKRIKRIVGGTLASRKEFPHMVKKDLKY